MRLTAFLFVLLTSLNASAKEVNLTPTKSGMYDVGGFKLYLECYQNDQPQLILEQGFGRFGSDGVWLEHIDRLKSQFSVCLYDRSGLGKSEKGEVPFTVNDMATRLKKLLEAADVKGPYYFAGGSYASYIIKAYNNLYPNDVLGAVLIDPPALGYFYTMGNRWPKDFKTENENLQRYFQFEQSVHDPMFKRVPENVDHMASYALLTKAAGYGNKPIIVLRAKQSDEKYDPPFVPENIAKKMETHLAGSEAYFAGLSEKSEIIYSTSDKHHLHITDPDLVVNSIKSLLSK